MLNANNILSAISLLFLSVMASASHISGADVNWEEMGKDTFLITINEYRDCNSFNNSTPDIFINAKCGTLKVSTTESTPIDITPVCEEQATRCDSRGVSFQYGFELVQVKGIFVATDLIKKGCCNFEITWEKCCRTGRISTGLANKELFIKANLNACVNLDLAWDKTEIPMLCIGRDTEIQLSLTTNNPKDSIAYSFAEPKRDSSTVIKYGGSYNYKSFIYYLGFPKTNLNLPRGIHLDSLTGQLKFRPMKVEHTAAAFKAEVFRNGIKIGETIKDISMVVIKCPDNVPPSISGFDIGFNTNDYSRIVCANATSKFTFSTTDDDYKDTVRLSSTSTIGDSIVVINPGSKRDSVHWYWTPDTSYISENSHNLFLRATDNACPLIGKKETLYKIKVIDAKTLQPILKQIALDSCGHYKFRIVDTANIPLSAEWYVNNQFIGKGSSITHLFSNKGLIPIQAKINGCDSITVNDTIDIKQVNQLKINFNDTAICATKVVLNPKLKGNSGPAKYTWTIDPQLNYTGSASAGKLAIDLSKKPGLKNIPISLSIVDSIGCKIQREIVLSSKYVQKVTVDRGGTFCQNDQSKTLKTYLGKGHWYGEDIANNTMYFDKLKQGVYVAEYINDDAAVCLIDTAKFIINEMPMVIIGDDFTSCTSAEIKNLNALPVGGLWSGNGIIKNDFNPAIAGKNVHILTYHYTSKNGCSNSDSLRVNVLDYVPQVSITDSLLACEYDTLIEISSSKNGGTWSGNSLISTSNPLFLKVSEFELGTTFIKYNYTDSNECTILDSSQITISEAPKTLFTIKDTLIGKGDSLIIINNTNNKKATSFIWTMGNPALITKTTQDFLEIVDTVGIFDITLEAINNRTGCTYTSYQKNAITVDRSIGLDIKPSEISLYPNPSSGIFIINSPKSIKSIKVFNSVGQEVSYSRIGENMVELNKKLPGVYYLELIPQKSTKPIRFTLILKS